MERSRRHHDLRRKSRVHLFEVTRLRLFEVTRPSPSSPWGTPVTVTAASTAADDVDPSITADGTELYYSTNTTGLMDIYRVTRSCQ